MKILIADDHPLFRGALRETIASGDIGNGEDISLLEASDIETAQNLLKEHDDCDLLLLDLHIPGAQGFSGLANLRGCYPFVPIAMISGSDAPYIIQRAADLGAAGFISKSASPDEIRQSITNLLEGKLSFPDLRQTSATPVDAKLADVAEKISTLTPHQFRVFSMISTGLLNKQIAYEMGISETTVKSHIKIIFSKLGVGKRTEIIILANALQIDPQDIDISRDMSPALS